MKETHAFNRVHPPKAAGSQGRRFELACSAVLHLGFVALLQIHGLRQRARRSIRYSMERRNHVWDPSHKYGNEETFSIFEGGARTTICVRFLSSSAEVR